MIQAERKKERELYGKTDRQESAGGIAPCLSCDCPHHRTDGSRHDDP